MSLAHRAMTVGLLFGVSLFSAGRVQAQSTSAALAGEVRTQTGEPVGGAVVQARSDETGATRSGITDDAGRYRIDSLSPGRWDVVARLADGRLSRSRRVQLHLQETVRLDFTVGSGLTEQITVTAEAPLVDPRETTRALRINAERVGSLPLAGRAFTDLSLLDSAVRPAAPGNFVGERGSVFMVNGQSGRSNSFLVDGLDNNDQVSGTTLNSFFSAQVIEEFVLLTHQYAPEFGRASGAVLNIVTRRGTNEPRWDAFLQGTAARWNPPGDFVESLPDRGTSQDARSGYQTGFTWSGPLRKDRAFYFLAYEHQENDDVIPFTGLLREDIENPGATGGGRMLAPAGDDNLFFRTDYNLGAAHSLMIRLSLDDRETHGVNVGGVYTPESGFRIAEQDLALAASLTSVVSAGVINEVRVLAASSKFDQFANSDRPGVARPSGIFGGNNLNRQERGESRFQIVENLTLRRGEHTFKFGLDVTRSRTKIATLFNPNGNFIYNTDVAFEPGDCGDLFFSDVLNAPDRTAIQCGDPDVDEDGDGDPDEKGNIYSYPLVYTYIFGQPAATLDDTRLGLFAQDRWQVGPRLLLDYGLRYDVSSYELPRDAAVDSVVPNGGAGRDTDNVAPRLGFTFTPWGDQRLVIRGGGGVFYDKLVLGFPAVAAITSGTEIGLFFPQGFTWERDEAYVEEIGIDVLLPELELLKEQLSSLVMRFSTGTELDTPYAVQVNLGVDGATGRHSAFGVNVTRAQGYHLPLMKDLNPVDGLNRIGLDCNEDNIDPGIETFEGLPCHLSDSNTGSIASVVSEGRSWYTGLDLSWRWQLEGSWCSASYTWSKAEDMGFDPLKGGISLPPNSRDLSGERGRADGDRRHRMVVSGDAQLPWMGLRASGVLQISTGIPFNVTTGTDDNVDGILSDRPEGVGRNTGENTPLEVINAERIKQNERLPADRQLELFSGSLHEPSFSQVDVRLYRPFAFGAGRGRGEAYFQVFNVLDRENAGLIEGRAGSRNFGRTITLAGPPRMLEFGIRFSY